MHTFGGGGYYIVSVGQFKNKIRNKLVHDPSSFMVYNLWEEVWEGKEV